MKYLFLILTIFVSTFCFEDKVYIMLHYDSTKIKINTTETFSRPDPEYNGFGVDHENILNGFGEELLAFSVEPLNSDSVRKMNDIYDRSRYSIYNQFDRIDSSWIEKKYGLINIVVWPRDHSTDAWNTSLVMIGDTSQNWGDIITVGSKFNFTQ